MRASGLSKKIAETHLVLCDPTGLGSAAGKGRTFAHEELPHFVL